MKLCISLLNINRSLFSAINTSTEKKNILRSQGQYFQSFRKMFRGFTSRIVSNNSNYRIYRPITRALSMQKGSEIVKNEHARYTLERFPTDNARVICTKKGIGKYGIMY